MAEKISVQIALEGGAEIERQLAGISAAGTKAFDEITKAAEQAGGFKNLKPEEVTASLKQMGTVGVGEINKIQAAVKSAAGFEKLVLGVQAVENGFAAVGRAALAIAPAIIGIGTAAGTVFVKMAQQTIAFAEEVGKANAQAIALGTSIEKLDRVKIGFEALGLSASQIGAGLTQFKSSLDKIDLQRVTTAFKELQEAATRGFGVQGTQQLQALEEAAKGIGPAAQFARKALTDLGVTAPAIDGASAAMQRLGITTTDVSKALPEFVAKLRQMPESLERNNLALDVFGRSSGPAFIQALKEGGSAVDQFIQRHQALTQAQADMASKLEGSINRMISAWGRFNSLTLAPAIIAGVDLVTNAITALNQAMARLTFESAARAAADVGKLGNALSGIPGLLHTIGQGLVKAFTPEPINATNQALAQTGATAAQVKQQFQIVANPFTGMPEAIRVTTTELEKAGATAAQTKQQFQIVANPFTGMPEAIRITDDALKQTGATAAQTGQQLTQAGQQSTAGWDPSKIQVWNEELGKAVPAAQQAGQASAQAGQQGQTGWTQLANVIREADAAVTKFVGSIVGIAWDTISSVGVTAWNALTGAIGRAYDALLKFIGLRPSAPPTGGGAPGKARGGLLGGRGTGTSDSNLAWVSRGEHIMPAHVVRRPGVLALLEALRRSGGLRGYAAGGPVGGTADALIIGPVLGRLAKQLMDLIKKLAEINNALFDATKTVMNTVTNSLTAITQQTFGALRSVADAIESVANELTAMENAIGAKGGKARGGLLGGRGTGTSDSNLAWVSRGEYITPARAVRQPGVLALLEALRRSGGNLRRVLDGMGRFALGGMVPRTMPAFAGGGLAGGMSNVTIQFPGLPPIGGLRAPAAVVDELRQAAAMAQVRSGGRKPSRYS